MIKSKKLTIVLVVLMFALVISLLFLVDRKPKEYSLENPYYEDHPEEMVLSYVQFLDLQLHNGLDANREIIENENNVFEKGQPIYVYVEIDGFMKPKVKENYYLFGIQETIEVRDEYGEEVPFVGGLLIDVDNHFQTKEEILMFNNQLPTNNLEIGQYVLRVVVYDKISKETIGSHDIMFEIK